MYFVIYYKDSLKVTKITTNEPTSLPVNLGVARCEERPHGLYFTVGNLQNHVETVIDLEGVETTREYQTCTLNLIR